MVTPVSGLAGAACHHGRKRPKMGTGLIRILIKYRENIRKLLKK